MMTDTSLSDSRLSSALRNYMDNFHHNEVTIKGLRLCGSRILPTSVSGANKVFLVVNKANQTAHYAGLAHCRSPWSCPYCTPKVMADVGGKIASLIDARKKWYNQHAFMLTFTMPHTRDMPLGETLTVLKDAWRMFNRSGNRDEYINNGYLKHRYIFGRFRNKFSINSIVRVYEVNWGYKNGWHPHIHGLFWTTAESFPHLLEFEDQLTDHWLHCLKHCHKLYLESKFLPTDKLDSLYAEYKSRPWNGHRAVYFSRNKDGTVKKCKSSQYISGWSGSSELTSTTSKESQLEGHFTVFQLLAKYDENNPATYKWAELFIEYAKATRGSKRTSFSPKDNALIRKWRTTEEYVTTLKKNITDKATDKHAVFWFNKQQWQEILCSERARNPHLRVDLLQAAILDPSTIPKILLLYGIDVTGNDLNHPDFIWFEQVCLGHADDTSAALSAGA